MIKRSLRPSLAKDRMFQQAGTLAKCLATAVGLLGLNSHPALAQAPNPDTVNVRDFGARGDGKSDDTVPMQAALRTGRAVFIPIGTYLVNNVQPTSNQRIYGEGSGSILKQMEGAAYVLSINPGTGGSTDSRENVHHVSISDLAFVGLAESKGFSEHHHLVNLNAVSDVIIERCTFAAFQGDAVYLGSGNVAGVERHNRNVVLRNNVFDGVNKQNRNGITVIDGDTIDIKGNRFTRTSRRDMPGAVDVEPNADRFAVIRNITISRNTGEDVGGGVGFISVILSLPLSTYTDPPRNIVVEDNEVNGSPGYTFVCRADANVASPSMDLVVRRNRIIDAAGRGLQLGGIRGALIQDNVIVRTSREALLGFDGNAVADVQLSGNLFEGGAGSRFGLEIRNASRISVERNVFRGYSAAAVVFGKGRTDHVSLTDNIFDGAGHAGSKSIEVQGQHLTVRMSNEVARNVLQNGAVGAGEQTLATSSSEAGGPGAETRETPTRQ